MYRDAYETLESVFAGTLDHLSYSRPETKTQHFEHMKLSLTRPVEISIHNHDYITLEVKDVQPTIESTKGARKNSHLYLSTYISSHRELSSKILDYASIPMFFHGSYFSISDGKFIKLNYRDIVRTIYSILSATELQDQQLDVSYYETQICEFQVLKDGQAVMTKQDLPEELKEDIEKRASMMYKVITTSNLLECLKFAVFIGPENAGNTTLINSKLGENIGGVGFTTHTMVATPYRFKDDIYLVDFPGTDGGGDRAQLSKIWEEYEKVGDLCVVVLNLGGDTSRAAQSNIPGGFACSAGGCSLVRLVAGSRFRLLSTLTLQCCDSVFKLRPPLTMHLAHVTRSTADLLEPCATMHGSETAIVAMA